MQMNALFDEIVVIESESLPKEVASLSESIYEWKVFEDKLARTKLRISSMSFCAKLPEQAMTPKFISSIHQSPFFRERANKKKKAKPQGIKKQCKSAPKLTKTSLKQPKQCNEQSSKVQVVTKNEGNKDNLSERKKKHSTTQIGGFIVSYHNNHVTVKFFQTGSIQICGCRSVKWLTSFFEGMYNLTGCKVMSLRPVNIILNGNIRKTDQLNCAEISKYLNRNDNAWELSDFFGQTCTRSLQLFYNSDGKRTYAGVFGNGTVRIISADVDRALLMFSSIQTAVYQIEEEEILKNE